MFNTIKIYFLLFLIYSFLGWCMEVCVSLVERKRFVNRGFLLGPYCPIYGSGAILITLLLNAFKDKPVLIIFYGYISMWYIGIFNELFYGKDISLKMVGL